MMVGCHLLALQVAESQQRTAAVEYAASFTAVCTGYAAATALGVNEAAMLTCQTSNASKQAGRQRNGMRASS